MANTFSFVFSVYYVLQFVQCSKHGAQVLSIKCQLAGVFVIAVATIAGAVHLPLANSCELIGNAGIASSILTYMGPLASAREVVAKKNADSIAVPFLVASTLCSLLWWMYGMFGLHDARVVAPNYLGMASSLMQGSLITKYGTSKNVTTVTYEEEAVTNVVVDPAKVYVAKAEEGIECVSSNDTILQQVRQIDPVPILRSQKDIECGIPTYLKDSYQNPSQMMQLQAFVETDVTACPFGEVPNLTRKLSIPLHELPFVSAVTEFSPLLSTSCGATAGNPILVV